MLGAAGRWGTGERFRIPLIYKDIERRVHGLQSAGANAVRGDLVHVRYLVGVAVQEGARDRGSAARGPDARAYPPPPRVRLLRRCPSASRRGPAETCSWRGGGINEGGHEVRRRRPEVLLAEEPGRRLCYPAGRGGRDERYPGALL